MNNAEKLRDVLFDALADIKSGAISKEQVDSMVKIGQTIINSAKAEVDAHKAGMSSSESTFISKPQPLTVNGNVTTHRIN